MHSVKSFLKNTRADAVVEAAILFPIMIMVFAALVLLAVYLPTRAALQRATQYAATAMAVQWSDTWLFFDESAVAFYWESDKNRLDNVYAALFSSGSITNSMAETIVTEIESRSISSNSGELSVDTLIINRIIYREIVVTATREFTVPVNLSIIKFPETISITVSSTAVVHDGDEFIRNADLATDFSEFISDRFGLGDLGDSIRSYGSEISSLLGWG